MTDSASSQAATSKGSLHPHLSVLSNNKWTVQNERQWAKTLSMYSYILVYWDNLEINPSAVANTE